MQLVQMIMQLEHCGKIMKMRREKKRKKSERVSKYISPFYNFVAELRMKRKKRKQKLKKSRVLDGFLI